MDFKKAITYCGFKLSSVSQNAKPVLVLSSSDKTDKYNFTPADRMKDDNFALVLKVLRQYKAEYYLNTTSTHIFLYDKKIWGGDKKWQK
jgi:hypothetical protein